MSSGEVLRGADVPSLTGSAASPHPAASTSSSPHLPPPSPSCVASSRFPSRRGHPRRAPVRHRLDVAATLSVPRHQSEPHLASQSEYDDTTTLFPFGSRRNTVSPPLFHTALSVLHQKSSSSLSVPQPVNRVTDPPG